MRDASELMVRELGQRELLPDYLSWWYFDNPIGCCSISGWRRDGRLIGISTMNAFPFRIADSNMMIGMPQKVLVERASRGKGIFGALYESSEKDCLEKGAGAFITFTNEASTPIFLSKFGYRRGRCPDVIIRPFLPTELVGEKRYRKVGAFADDMVSEINPDPQNRLLKSREYFVWRYLKYRPDQYDVLEVSRATGQRAGYAVLKRVKKGGAPVYLLMDLWACSEADIGEIAEQSFRFSCRNFAAGLLMLAIPSSDASRTSWVRFTVSNRFNFLVKGRDRESTERLAAAPFDLTFGDMDFT